MDRIKKAGRVFTAVLFSMVFVFCAKRTTGESTEPDINGNNDAAEYARSETLAEVTQESSKERALKIDENYMLGAGINDVLVNVQWYNSGSGGERLRFYRDFTWTLTDFFGLGEFVKGAYLVNDDSEVILELSNVEYINAGAITGNDSSAKEAFKNVFGGEINLTFVLQRNYADFYAVGRLYNAQFNKNFRSNISSPENENYELDGIIVTKRNGKIAIEEVTAARKAPFDDAKESGMFFADRFDSFTNYLKEGKKEISVVLPGEVFNYDAIYTAEDNELWYRIKIDIFMAYETAWIYGKFVNNDPENMASADFARITKALAEAGYIDMPLPER